METSTPPNSDIRQNNNFGFLRLLFAALVVVSHSSESIDGNRSRELLTRIFGTLSFGDVAVDGFFLISGYLVTKSYHGSSSVSYYLAKRALRIYPGFIVAFLICTFIVGRLAGGDLTEISPSGFFTRLALLHEPYVAGAFNGLPYPQLNPAMWTISYEFRCYLLVILVGSLTTRENRRAYAIVLIGLAFVYFSQSVFQDFPDKGTYLTGHLAPDLRFISMFFVDAAFYVWRDSIVFSGGRTILALIALSGLMFLPRLAEPAFAVFGGYLIFWYACACLPGSISRVMDHTDPSYGLYLYAWPIQNLLILNIPDISPAAVTAITLSVATVLGLLSWRFVEKPALRHKHFRLQARTKTIGLKERET